MTKQEKTNQKNMASNDAASQSLVGEELGKIHRSIDELAKTITREPDAKGWWRAVEWALPKSGLLSVSVAVLTIIFMIKGCEDSRRKNAAENQSNFNEQVNDVREKQRRARDQLNVILGDSSKEQAFILLLRTLANFVGHETQLDDAYSLFSFRTVSDLQVERAISLRNELKAFDRELEEILMNASHSIGSKAEDKTTNSTHEIKDLFLIAVLLAQSGDLIAAEIYAAQCLAKIESKYFSLKRQVDNTPISAKADFLRAQLEIYSSNLVHAKTLHALMAIVANKRSYYPSLEFFDDYNRLNGNASSYFPNERFDEIYELLDDENSGMHSVRAKLAKGAVLALEALTAVTIFESWHAKYDNEVFRCKKSRNRKNHGSR